MRFTLPIFLVAILSGAALYADDRVIGGEEVKGEDYPFMVQIKAYSAGCSGMIVGPRVVLTSAHCISGDGKAVATFNGKQYDVKFEQNPRYNDSLLTGDIALGISKTEFNGAKPIPVGSYYAPNEGDAVDLMGFGCSDSQSNVSDYGKLRIGSAKAADNQDKENLFDTYGDALCFGDSGGGAFMYDKGAMYVVGTGSTGNLKDRSVFSRLTARMNYTFIQQFVAKHKAEIYGVWQPPPPPPPPTKEPIPNP